MSSFLYLTRTVRLPVKSDGNLIIDAAGETLATASSPIIAAAMSDLMNLGHAPAKALEDDHDSEERDRTRMFMRSILGSVPE